MDRRAVGLRFPTRLGAVSADVVITEHQNPEASWAVGDHAARQDGVDDPLPDDVGAAVTHASEPAAGAYPRAEWTGLDEAHRVPHITVHRLILAATATSDELPSPRIGVGAALEERLGDELRQNVEAWYQLAASWVEVHTAQDLDYENPRFDAWVEGGALATFSVSGSRLRTGGRIVLTTHFEIPASPALLALAFTRAATGEPPPLPHSLLRDARAAYHRKSYRRAVIDAAVAAEVALAEWVNAQGIVVKHPGLGNFVRVLHEKGPLSSRGRDRLRTDLVKPRNRAVHSGGATSLAEASGALEAARAIVGELAPLDAV